MKNQALMQYKIFLKISDKIMNYHEIILKIYYKKKRMKNSTNNFYKMNLNNNKK